MSDHRMLACIEFSHHTNSLNTFYLLNVNMHVYRKKVKTKEEEEM